MLKCRITTLVTFKPNVVVYFFFSFPLQEFFAPHLKMFSEIDFSEQGLNIDLTVPVINMDDTGYGTKTQSVDVMGGV